MADNTIREPWTTPYTLKERASIRYSLKRYDLWRFWDSGLWQRLAFALPDRVALWAFIRVMAYASARVENGTRHPNSITYEEAYKAWTEKE